MRESKFQTVFLRWAQNQDRFKTAAFELKLTKEKSLPFKALLVHQKYALLNAKHRRVSYKIPDDSIGYKPFDCFIMSKVPAFVVIRFYRVGEKYFYLIDIDDWIEEEKNSNRKSITEDRAKEIGIGCLLNKDYFV